MNLPNKLTCLRMVLIVPFVVFMLIGGGEGTAKWIALAIFIFASLTDLVDGKIARKYNLITDFGKFMDPLADKLLVCSAMICLVELGRLPAWICIIIIAREFAISGFRLIASDKGVVIAANMWGKTKTVSQMTMVILMIANINHPVMTTLTTVIMYVACALTLISLVTYILDNKDVMTSM